MSEQQGSNASTGSNGSNQDEWDNPLARKHPLGGRTGVAIVSITPIVALVLFFVFGLAGGWAWSWLFFIAIPIVSIIVYGARQPERPNQ